MSEIKILDDYTINKIAAGEVVERPASVVKELVENSIDAGASTIAIDIKNGGVDLIRITDNGKGIPKNQMEIAFERHATSKIQKIEDLQQTISLGFRGEALSSISSVSQVELISKQANAITGKRVVLEGGKIKTSEEIACPEGTTFIMRNLFFNVPARKSFLKTTTTEKNRISDYLYQLALANPQISFKYFYDGKLIFQTQGNSPLKNVLFELYGKDIAKQTIEVQFEQENMKVVGLIGKPIISRANRTLQHIFINGRCIKSSIIQKAIEEAFKTYIMVGKYPVAILHIQMDIKDVDVNVHPAKLEVRFKDEDKIYSLVYIAVHEALVSENMVRSINDNKKIKPQPPKIEKNEVDQIKVQSFFAPKATNNMLKYDTLLEKRTSSTQKPKIFDEVSYEVPSNNEPMVAEAEVTLAEFVNEEVFVEADKFLDIHTQNQMEDVQLKNDIVEISNNVKHTMQQEISKPKYGLDYRIIGQIFKTYWLIEHHNKVYIMDQHAGHERVMYEIFMQKFNSGNVPTQQLLVAQTLHLTTKEMDMLQQNEELLQKVGFMFECFGETDILVREVPFIFNRPITISEFKQLIESFDPKKVKSMHEEHIIQLACKHSVRGNDNMSELECRNLVETLLTLENPYTCPHGRPTLISLERKDIEKLFNRI
ncbi:MAG: hypothetical protein ATN36_07600 [Epulopiscium sp. Nele67-Bin005]|nr:MAG: hypothetical protein ATN36_07600 [Epulopiscium sp. Nele67-Bin005]